VNLWPIAVGKKIAENTTVQNVEHGTLLVHAASPVWAQELQLQKKDILSKLNKTLGKKTIKDIRFV
jgi:predicted nucleic acid-binding Zn ribbon protein